MKTVKWDPQTSQDGHEMTIHGPQGCGCYRRDGEVDGSQVFSAKKHRHCEKSSGRVLVGTQLAGVMLGGCWWPYAGESLGHSGSANHEKELVFELFSRPHIPWPDAYPDPYCGPGNSGYEVWMYKLDAQIKNYPGRQQERLEMRRMREGLRDRHGTISLRGISGGKMRANRGGNYGSSRQQSHVQVWMTWLRSTNMLI